MAYSESIERWMRCKWSMAFGYGDREVADILAEAEERENFGCMKSEVIDSRNYTVYTIGHKRQSIQIATLHEHGKLTDESVIIILNQACLGCRFFKSRY